MSDILPSIFHSLQFPKQKHFNDRNKVINISIFFCKKKSVNVFGKNFLCRSLQAPVNTATCYLRSPDKIIQSVAWIMYIYSLFF